MFLVAALVVVLVAGFCRWFHITRITVAAWYGDPNGAGSDGATYVPSVGPGEQISELEQITKAQVGEPPGQQDQDFGVENSSCDGNMMKENISDCSNHQELLDLSETVDGNKPLGVEIFDDTPNKKRGALS